MSTPKKYNVFNRPITHTTGFKVAVGYFFITVVGLSVFYWVKRDINKNRVQTMRIREEIQNSPKSNRYFQKPTSNE